VQYAKLEQLLPWLRLPRPLRRLAAARAPLLPARSLRRALQHLGGASALDVAEGLLRKHDPADVALACGTSEADFCPTYREAFAAAADEDPVLAAMIADARTYLPDDILTKVDRASMSVALEARVPILDHRVVRFAFSLPRELRWHGGVTKAPLREIAYRRIPRELLDRPKQGFGIDVRTLLAEELVHWSDRYLDPARLAEEGNLSPAGVARLREDARPVDDPSTARLWRLLCFQRWFAHTHRGEPLD
jgi:asparagine synthase (glutamine-hydrolysing)